MIWGGGDVTRNISEVPRLKADLKRVVFSVWLLDIPNAIKKLLEVINVQCSGMTSF